MTFRERQICYQFIKRAIETSGQSNLKLASLIPMMREDPLCGPLERTYGGRGHTRVMLSQIPGLRIDTTNNDAVYLASTPDGIGQLTVPEDIKEALVCFASEQLPEGAQNIPVSALTRVMRANAALGDYVDLYGGESGVGELLDCLSSIAFNRAAGTISRYLTNEENELFIDSDTQLTIVPNEYPHYVNPDDPEVATVIAHLQSFAFMGYWSTVTKTLTRMTGFEGKDARIWSGIIALAWDKACKDNNFVYGRYLNTEDGQYHDLCVFSTGLRTIAQRTIYCVLQENAPEQREAGYQYWICRDYCASGDENTKFGRILETELHIPREKAKVRSLKGKLLAQLARLDKQRVRVAPILGRLVESRFPSGAELLVACNYLTGLRALVESPMFWETLENEGLDAASMTYEELVRTLSNRGGLNLLQIFEKNMQRVIAAVDAELSQKLAQNTREKGHPVSRFNAFLQEAAARIGAGEDVMQLMPDYRNYAELFSHMVRLLCDGVEEEGNQLCEAFNLTGFLLPVLSGVMHTSNPGQADEISALMRESEALLDQVESMNEEIDAAGNEALPDDEDGENDRSIAGDADRTKAEQAEVPAEAPAIHTDAPATPELGAYVPIGNRFGFHVSEVSDPFAPSTPESLTAEPIADKVTTEPSMAEAPIAEAASDAESASSELADDAGGGPEAPGSEAAKASEPEYFDPEWKINCFSGTISPDSTVLAFGNLKSFPNLGDAPADIDNPADTLLLEPAKRSMALLMKCIILALRDHKWRIAEWLLNPLQRAEMAQPLRLFTEVLSLENTRDEEDVGSRVMHTTYPALEAVTKMSDRGSQEERRLPTMVMLAAFIPLFQLYFQKEFTTQLFQCYEKLDEALTGRDVVTAIARLRACVESQQQDSRFLSYQDLTENLRSVIENSNAIDRIEEIKREAAKLRHHCENSRANYRNAREIALRFCTDEQPRSKALFESVLGGVLLPNARPFENDDDIGDFIDEHNHRMFPTAPPIVGKGRAVLVSDLQELTNLFNDLRDQVDILSRGVTGNPQWYLDLYREICGCQSAICLRLQDPLFADEPLQSYALELSARTACGPETDPKLPRMLVDIPAVRWPEASEDRIACALFELSGAQSQLVELSRAFAMADRRENEACRQAQFAMEAFNVNCHRLMSQLTALNHSSMIDRQEYQDMRIALSCIAGWLEAALNTLENGCLPAYRILNRFELELWYIDRRVGMIYERLGDLLRDKLRNYADTEAAFTRIRAAIEGREIQTIMDQFSDVVTQVSYLMPKENFIDLFSMKSIQQELFKAVMIEGGGNWRNCNYLGIIHVSVPGQEAIRLDPVADLNDVKAHVVSGLHVVEKLADAARPDYTATPDRCKVLRDFFAFLGFGTPEVSTVPGQKTEVELSFDVPTRQICPLPRLTMDIALREHTNRWRVRYKVRTLSTLEDLQNVLNTDGASIHGLPTILLCAFPVSFDTRRSMLMHMREEPRNHNYFMLDKVFLRYAMCIPSQDRLKAFYACCCTLMKPDPYTTQTETQWEGTFFGRETEIDAVMTRTNVLYGGRRLGKTSILKEAQLNWQRESENNMAYYINLQDKNGSKMWFEIAAAMKGDIPTLDRDDFSYIPLDPQEMNNTCVAIKDAIYQYMSAFRNVRILLLLDECDELVYSDTLNGIQDPNQLSHLGMLCDLMERTQNHLRVVLSGLDRVTRFTRNLESYSMPARDNDRKYARFVENLCLKPMIGRDMQNAYDLVDIPFRMMGYRVAREDVLCILRISCFRPNLIQNYCRVLLNAVRGRNAVSFAQDSLMMDVPHELVEQIHASSNHQDFLREQQAQSWTIPLNVGATAVYSVVANAVALLCNRNSGEGLINGFSAEEVTSEILRHNPAFSERGSCTEFVRTLLSELVGMGVLRSIIDNGDTYYTLFSSYMAHMLGSESDIEGKLNTALETYEANKSLQAINRREMFEERYYGIGADPLSFFPLTIGQMTELNAILNRSCFVVVTGLRLLLLDIFPDMLRNIRVSVRRKDEAASVSMNTELWIPEDAEKAGGLDELFEQAGGRMHEGNMLIIIWNAAMNDGILDMLRERDFSDCPENVRLVVLCDGRACFGCEEQLEALPKSAVLNLSRCAYSFRYSWLSHMNTLQHGRFGDDTAVLQAYAQQLGDATGDWPELLRQFGRIAVSHPEAGFDTLMDEFLTWRRDNLQDLLDASLGFLPEWLRDVLQAARPEDPLSAYLSLAPSQDEESERCLRNSVKLLQRLSLGELIGPVSGPLDTLSFRLSRFMLALLSGWKEV